MNVLEPFWKKQFIRTTYSCIKGRGTIIEGNSNVKLTITSIEPEDIDLSGYVTKDEFNTMKTSLESQINNLNTTVSQLQSLIKDTNADQ